MNLTMQMMASTARKKAAGNGLLNGLVAYWAMDEASGTRADSHATYDLTENGGTINATTGIKNNAASFVSANRAFLERSVNDVFTGTGAFSLSFWFSTNTDASLDGIFGFGDATTTGGGIVIRVETGGVLWTRFNGGQTANFGSGYADNSLHHAVFVKPANATAADVVVYIDGALATRNGFTGSTTLSTVSAGLKVGTKNNPNAADSGDYFSGVVDEIGAYNRVLTAADVTALYNSGAGLAYADLTT